MKNNTFGALKEKPFFYFWIGEIFTQIPTHLFNFFLILLVFKITNSNTAVSGAVLTFTLPAIFFGSIAGVYVDRWDKKRVLIISNILRAVLLICMIFFLNNLVMIYLISLFITVLVQFVIPAESPMIPLTVKEDNLLSANALFGMAIFGSILIAYVLSGPVLLILKPAKTLILLSILLLLGAFAISLIKMRTPIKSKNITTKPNFLKDVRSTFSLMSKTKEISSSLFLLAFSQILTLTIATIAPGYSQEILKIPIEDFALLFAAPAALGTVIGGVILVHYFHSYKKNKLIATGIFMSGIALLLLPYGSKVASRAFAQTLNLSLPPILEINILHIMVVLAFVIGVANSFVFVPANTILQEKTTDEIRGKIYGFLNSIIGLLSLFPIVLAGSLSDLIGVGAVITGIGVGLILLGFTWIFSK
ncbi:MAG TPA: MFS transporter [Candidatus Limnocylindrales bacterium]|nr:MFS transporter [Candidatus Limnocylindrales bacterium]